MRFDSNGLPLPGRCCDCRFWVKKGPSYSGDELGLCYKERLKTTSALATCGLYQKEAKNEST